MCASPRHKEDGILEPLVLTRTKVHVPPARPPLVERRALLGELESAGGTPVVLISAPPGYGKTTLLGQWAERDRRPFAYVHLDESDNDPVVMLAYITLALETLGQMDSVVKDALSAPEPALGRAVLPGIANDMADREPFVLVLDDVHAIRNETCLRTIEYLTEAVPDGSHLAIASRSDPPIPLASLRVSRKLLEIRGNRLTFDVAEAASLFEALDIRLDPRSLRRLVEQTEGWPAGLYLAALYLRECDEPDSCIDRFRGDHRSVADYFITEVLARQPDETVEFLRRTSILERLSGEMCDAVLERRGSAALLAEMEASIPFLIPLDEHREWYRYHNLFAELLAGELHAREPDRIPDLHRRAAAWYEAQGFVDRAGADVLPAEPGVERLTPRYFESALRHGLAAGDVTHAGELLARHWQPFADAGRLASLERILGDFTDEQIASHPPLALTAAWVAYLRGDADSLSRLLPHLEPMGDTGHAERRTFRSSVALLRAGLALGGLPDMRAHVEEAYALESETPTAWFGPSRSALAIVRLLEGDDDGARELLRDASGTEGHWAMARVIEGAALAVCEIDAGDWDAAREHALGAREFAEERALADSFPSSLAHAAQARVLAHDRDQAAARRTIERVLRLVGPSPPQWWHASLTLLVVAEAQLDIGDIEGVERTMEAARELVLSRGDAGALATRLARVQSAVGLRMLPEPLSPSELHVLEQLPSDMSLSRIAEAIYLSRNTVKTHVRSIYRKLGVGSREDAVALGRTLGLIG